MCLCLRYLGLHVRRKHKHKHKRMEIVPFSCAYACVVRVNRDDASINTSVVGTRRLCLSRTGLHVAFLCKFFLLPNWMRLASSALTDGMIQIAVKRNDQFTLCFIPITGRTKLITKIIIKWFFPVRIKNQQRLFLSKCKHVRTHDFPV